MTEPPVQGLEWPLGRSGTAAKMLLEKEQTIFGSDDRVAEDSSVSGKMETAAARNALLGNRIPSLDGYTLGLWRKSIT